MITSRGYSIFKDSCDVANIKKELTVSPKGYDIGPKVVFKLFLESETKLYVPKYYGLHKFGIPEKIKVGNGLALDPTIMFTGSLRKEQEVPVQKVVDACHDPLQMGGILNVFCGGGKTTMALYIITVLQRKTLIVVHKDFLLEQWKERIQQFLPAARIGLIKAKTIDVIDKDIVLASLQSLSMKEYDPAIFEQFGTVIVDEVHHTSAEVFSKALAKLCFRYTIGLTATATRKDGLSKVFQWYLGRIVHKAEKRSDFAKVHIVNYFVDDKDYCEESTIMGSKPNVSRMLNNICEYAPRNTLIVKLVVDILSKEPKRKMIILSDRRGHLVTLAEMLTSANFDVGIYMGGMKQTVLTECGNRQIILATYAIASEGYDQPGLNTLVLASPRSDVVQSVGRILRDKPEDRTYVPLIVDIIDTFNIFERQGQKRITYYEKCNWDVLDVEST